MKDGTCFTSGLAKSPVDLYIAVRSTTNSGVNDPDLTYPSQCYSLEGGSKMFCYSLFDYEVFTKETIGGNGGSPSIFHSRDQPIKLMRVWVGHGAPHNGVKAIYMETFQDLQGRSKTFTAGQIPASGPTNEITFAPGELITSDIVLGGNGVGTRLGYIGFKTTKRPEGWHVGDLHTPYASPAANQMISGIWVQAGSDINMASFLLVKQVARESIQSVSYPTLNAYTTGLTPKVFPMSGCNDGYTVPDTFSQKHSRSTGESSTWSISSTVSFGMSQSVEVSAGVPEIAEAKASSEFHWDVSVTGSYQQTQDTVKTAEVDFEMTIAPRTRAKKVCQWFDSQIPQLPYDTEIKYTFMDGSSWVQKTKGLYSGVYTSEATCYRHEEKLKEGEICTAAEKLQRAAVGA
jgi:hypothetical protein